MSARAEAAVIISATCIIFTLLRRRFDKLQNKVYMRILLVLVLNSFTGILGVLMDPGGGGSQGVRTLTEICAYLYFITHGALCPLLACYVLCVSGRIRRYTWKRNLLLLLPFIVTELLMLTNPLNHWSYYYDARMVFHRNWGEVFLYASAVFYLVFVMVAFFQSWKVIHPRRRFAISWFLAMVVAGAIIQLTRIDIQVELFAESMAALGLMLTVENEDDLIDGETGIYNRKALRLEMINLLANRQAFHVLCVKLRNADLIRRMTGSTHTETLSRLLMAEFARRVPRYQVYQTAPDTFLLTVLDLDRVRALRLARDLSARFEESWSFQNTDILLDAVIVLASVPDEIGSTADLFNLVDCPLPPDQDKKLFYGEYLSYLLRRRAVENAIQRGLDQSGFQVFYQPTYDIDGPTVHGAEAMVRLRDEQLGMLMPDEFIPIAEQIGLINDVDDYVLREVCAFLAEGTPAELGVGCINVNLSVLQCIQPGFAEHVQQIVAESGVERSLVNFEITESVGAEDYNTLGAVIRQFKSQGFRVYMDDYGTGYSNIQSIFSMDFDVIKIDKSILWGAQKSELGMIILENSVRMIRQMGRKILVEGVETEEQIGLLRKLGVDYLQGYYFSKPIPKEEFIALLSPKPDPSA